MEAVLATATANGAVYLLYLAGKLHDEDDKK
jgi:hypothetical protein